MEAGKLVLAVLLAAALMLPGLPGCLRAMKRTGGFRKLFYSGVSELADSGSGRLSVEAAETQGSLQLEFGIRWDSLSPAVRRPAGGYR